MGVEEEKAKIKIVGLLSIFFQESISFNVIFELLKPMRQLLPAPHHCTQFQWKRGKCT